MVLLVFGCSNEETIIVNPKNELTTDFFGENLYEQSVLLEIKNEDSHLKLDMKNSISHYFGKINFTAEYGYTLIPNKFISYGAQKKYSYNSKDSAYIHSNFHSKNHISPTIHINNHEYLIENKSIIVRPDGRRVDALVSANYLDYKIKDSIVFDIEYSSVIFHDDSYYDSILVMVEDKIMNLNFYKDGKISYNEVFEE